MTKIIEKQKLNEGEDHYMNFGEVFDDFEHKDFTAKNVRVRPISGFTHGDETRDGRQSNISKGNTEGNDDGEGNRNISNNFRQLQQACSARAGRSALQD